MFECVCYDSQIMVYDFVWVLVSGDNNKEGKTLDRSGVVTVVGRKVTEKERLAFFGGVF